MKFNCDCTKKYTKSITNLKKKENSIDFEIISPFKDVLSIEMKYTHELVIDFETSQREIKKDGSPYKNKTKSNVSISIKYCPFCGNALVDRSNKNL